MRTIKKQKGVHNTGVSDGSSSWRNSAKVYHSIIRRSNYPKQYHHITQKKRKIYASNVPKISGHVVSRSEGWIVLNIYGKAYERGYAHGYLLSDEMRKIDPAFRYIVTYDLKVSFDKYLRTCSKELSPIIKRDFAELYEELEGILDGFTSKGLHMTLDYLIAWNGLLSMYTYFRNTNAYKCSAFIATGSATKNGKIVMAHNTHAAFIVGQTQNIMLYVHPSDGFPFVMQCAPGYIASGTDWFICSSGIMGCETTISNTNYRPKFGSPYFCRIRQAMQYGKTLDEYVEYMLKNNAGDYACSWQFGDNNTNEIMLFELGYKKHAIQRTHNGVYYGMNSAIDFELRTSETNDKDLYNIEKSSGARNFRLNQLLNDTYYGNIDRHNAKKILSDHYDVFLHKNALNSRTICKHSEYDEGKFTGKPFYPFGCTDGKVVDTYMATKLQFEGRFGSCCGRSFNAHKHIQKYPKYKEMENILEDLPKKSWITIKN